MWFTIKNYGTPQGVSRAVYKTYSNQTKEIYQLKGPMGKGLMIKQSGVHIAFAGGTGVLVFLDLVS